MAPHQAKALLLRCMDFRLEPAISEWLKAQGLVGKVDIVSIAGAAKNLVAAPTDVAQNFVLNHIRLGHELHHISEVILMSHTDCGAYGGVKSFASEREERGKLVSDAKAARGLIRGRFPRLEIRIVLAKVVEQKGEWQVMFEEVE
jgi:carbonic anhydrase